MNDTLKQVNQEGAPAHVRRKRRTPVQRVERFWTDLRLSCRRGLRQLRAIAPAAAKLPLSVSEHSAGKRQLPHAVPASSAGARVPVRDAKGAACAAATDVPTRSAKAAACAAATDIPTRSAKAAACAAAIDVPARSAKAAVPAHSTGTTAGDLWTACTAKAAQLPEIVRSKSSRILRRWRHIRREQAAKRFPESNRIFIQLVLFLHGLLPMAGSHLRERVWGHHKRAIRHFEGFATWVEHHHVHPAAFLGVAGSLAAVILLCSFYTIGTTVTFRGEVIAKVSSTMAAKSACEDLESVTRSTLGGSYTIDASEIQYDSGIMPRAEVVDENAFEEELSANIGLVTHGYALYVNGEMIGATPYEGALDELLTQLQSAVTTENTISCDFQQDVEIKPGYVPSEKIMNLGYLAETLYSTKMEEVTYTVKKGDTWSQIAESHDMTTAQLLAMNPGYNVNKLQIGEVLTLSAAVPYLTLTVTERERYVTQVPYDIEYTDSANLYQGDTKVLSAGQYGSADVVANVTYVNGEETARTVLSYVTLTNPVTEQQARGTKVRPTWLPTGTFRWPCSGNITSTFGGRRSPGGIGSTNHKGIDIANRRGTTIVAADGGTVVYAGWMSGYGYLVQIDHGNGYMTYYGHNSSLSVSVGKHVYKGQQIARMGSTGNSTGNHCHFEVRYHGVAKNPMNYLP